MRSTILLVLIIGIFAFQKSKDLYKIVSDFEARYEDVIKNGSYHERFLELFHSDFIYDFCPNTYNLTEFADVMVYSHGMIRNCTPDSVLYYSIEQEITYDCAFKVYKHKRDMASLWHTLKKNKRGEWLLIRVTEKRCPMEALKGINMTEAF